MYRISERILAWTLVKALGVPLVHGLARTSRTALGTVEVDSAALSVESRTASLRRGLCNGDESSRRSRSGSLLLGGSRRRRASSGSSSSTASAASTTGPDLGSGHGELLASVVDGEVGIGVSGLVSARELGSRTRSTATATLNLDLNARNVVLRLVDVRPVDTDVLEAHQVLAVGSILGDLGRNPVPVVGAPGIGGEVSVAADTLLEDLEPVTVDTVIGLDASSRGLGHVDHGGARVLELSTNGQLEADLFAGVHSQDLGLASGGKGSLVAHDIGTIGGGTITDIGRGVGGELDGVVLGGAARLANVLEFRLSNTALNVGAEEVMGGGHLGDSGEGDSRELHTDRAVANVCYRSEKKSE